MGDLHEKGEGTFADEHFEKWTSKLNRSCLFEIALGTYTHCSEMVQKMPIHSEENTPGALNCHECQGSVYKMWRDIYQISWVAQYFIMCLWQG